MIAGSCCGEAHVQPHTLFGWYSFRSNANLRYTCEGSWQIHPFMDPTHDLGRPPGLFIDVLARVCLCLDGCGSRLLRDLAVSSYRVFSHILHISSRSAGAFTEYIVHAPSGSVLPAGVVAHRLVVVLHLLSNLSRRHEVAMGASMGSSWTDFAVTLVEGIGRPVAEVAGWCCLWESWKERVTRSCQGTQETLARLAQLTGNMCIRHLQQYTQSSLFQVSGIMPYADRTHMYSANAVTSLPSLSALSPACICAFEI